MGGAIFLYSSCWPAAGADEGLEGRWLWQWRRGVGRGGDAHPAGCGGREPAPAKATIHGFVRWPCPRHARYEHGTKIVCNSDGCQEYIALCGSSGIAEELISETLKLLHSFFVQSKYILLGFIYPCIHLYIHLLVWRYSNMHPALFLLQEGQRASILYLCLHIPNKREECWK